MCCKAKGHDISECPRDPNFKTGENLIQENERIATMKENRIVFAETMTQTAKLLKKSVILDGHPRRQ
jgi:hypothetical protein